MLLNLMKPENRNIISIVLYIISSLMVIFLVMPLHEWAHGFVAYKLGDKTAKLDGRLTLNPLAHIDYLGAAMILLMGFGWAKPVPVNPRYFKKPRRDVALTSLAGPVSNLLAAIVFGLTVNLIMMILIKTESYYSIAGSVMGYTLVFFKFLMTINISLAVFNFIPVPPLDGSKILMALLPDKAIFWIEKYQMYITIGFFTILLSFGSNILYRVQQWLCMCIGWLTWLPFSWAFPFSWAWEW